MTWQPMETAPKDGTYMLAYNAVWGLPCVVQWEPQVSQWCDYSGVSNPQPTHWMPLPEPPEAKS